MSNIYYDPEKFGLTVAGEADAGGGYEFDKFVVWRGASGDYLWDDDSGCSCPTPFEDTHFGNVRRGTARDVLTDLRAWAVGDHARAKAAQSLIEALERQSW